METTRRGQSPPGSRRGSSSTVLTEDTAATTATERGAEERIDAVTLERAREIASRLVLPRPRPTGRNQPGVGELRPLPFRGSPGEIEIDRTVENLLSNPGASGEELVIRTRVLDRREVILVIDASGSMRGERIKNAAAALGALSTVLHRDRLAVLAFWSDAAWLQRPGVTLPATELIDRLLEIPAKGLTNVSFPLEEATKEARRVGYGEESRVILLSDCVHNAGPDPRPLAAQCARLDILLDVSGEHDPELARALAKHGRGRIKPIRGHREIAPAINALFAA